MSQLCAEDGQLCRDCTSGVHLGPIDYGYDDPNEAERDFDWNDAEDVSTHRED